MVLPQYEAGRLITAPGAVTLVGAFRRYSGSTGSGKFSLAASAWKLFQSAMILVGPAGASSSTSRSDRTCPVGRATANISPSCTETPDGVSVPKPVFAWWRKRTQWVTRLIWLTPPQVNWVPRGRMFHCKDQKLWRAGTPAREPYRAPA